MFGRRFAAHSAKRYRVRGLDRVEQQIVDHVSTHDLTGVSVLEIGGGVGSIQLELLRRGAARATNLELVDSYDEAAVALAADAGLADRITRRQVDIAASPQDVEKADVVILNRVVCCYPDYERLLGAAADHARRLLVFSHPPRHLVSRSLIRTQNLIFSALGKEFRTFAHPPERMVAVAQERGLDPTYRGGGPVWQVVGLERAG